MRTPWKTISLFISSTFRDMHAERDQLNNVVFPAIREELQRRRCRLEPIDLRVGVETAGTQTERERELQILKVCLAEIERSRPFLLVLLGDRYGWVPGGDRIAAAASEAGFENADIGSSVTALEIQYGLLKKDRVQRRRCLLCLREPLPYDRMLADKAAIYSDAHATDEGAPERVRRLAILKDAILADPELAEHRQPYPLGWDEQRGAPSDSDIAAWGLKVEAALWKLLDAETADRVTQTEPTWEEQERFAIEEMVERLAGSVVEHGAPVRQAFVGRTPLVRQVLDLARSPARDGAPWGLCLTGGTGTGKSALFARLHHELSGNADLLLLSHAASVSPRAGQTEWMLRRWIGELGAALGETPAVPGDIKPEDLEKLFAQWLHRVAATRRVVVLVDALNQFLRTERARHVSWLPVLWPANARFIATAIPGEESGHLARRPGVALADVPPLDATEAGAVAEQVYAHFHRTPNPDVLRELFALHEPGGTPAAGNPLWLTLALDLLNQLDADDFTVAESAAGGSAGEKLQRYVMARARTLPPDVGGLYGELLARVEKVAGMAETRAFAALIALSRHGWREEDLQHLLPAAAELLSPASPSENPQSAIANPQSWDPLRFAILRRCFRAHLVRRGALEQWDFAHATLRQAIHTRLVGEWLPRAGMDPVPALYVLGAEYLDAMPPGTGVREEEIMWQMLGTRDGLRVAHYYAHSVEGSKLLALYLAEDEARCGNPLRLFVISLFHVGGADSDVLAAVARKFNFDLNDALEIEGHLSLRTDLLTAAHNTLARFAASDPTNAKCQRDFSVSLGNLGDLAVARGHLTEALRRFTEAKSIAERLAASDPADAEKQRDLSVSLIKLGDLAAAQGDLAGTLLNFTEAKSIAERLAASDSGNVEKQRDVCVSLVKLADLAVARGDLAGAFRSYSERYNILERLAASDPTNAKHQRDFSVSLGNLGDLAVARGHLTEALRRFTEAKSIAERLAVSDPSNSGWQRDLSVSLNKLGDLAVAQGDLARALANFTESKDIFQRLASSDPANAAWQRDLWMSNGNLGDLAKAQGNISEAFSYWSKANHNMQRLADSDPTNSEWQRDLAVALNKLGDLTVARGDLVGALHSFTHSKIIRERLAASDPANAAWQRDLSVSLERLGNVAVAQGNLAGALHSFTKAEVIAERLAASDPNNIGWQRGRSVSLIKLGDLSVAQGDLAGALHNYTKAKVIAERLAASDPNNAKLQSDLSALLNRLGDFAVTQGNLGEALRSFTRARLIAERLAANDPTNADLQHTLSVLLNRLGDLAVTQGDLAGALRSFSQSETIRERLAASDPANASWQHDLSYSYAMSAQVLVKQARWPDAIALMERSLAIDERLAASDRSNMTWQNDVQVSRQMIARLRAKAGGRADSATIPSSQRGNKAARSVIQPLQQITVEELRQSAAQCFQRRQWEASAINLEKLLVRGEPLAEHGPKLVTCLLNAHEDLLSGDAAKIEAILNQLAAAGHIAIASDLRRQFAAKQSAYASKSWWKFW